MGSDFEECWWSRSSRSWFGHQSRLVVPSPAACLKGNLVLGGMVGMCFSPCTSLVYPFEFAAAINGNPPARRRCSTLEEVMQTRLVLTLTFCLLISTEVATVEHTNGTKLNYPKTGRVNQRN